MIGDGHGADGVGAVGDSGQLQLPAANTTGRVDLLDGELCPAERLDADELFEWGGQS
jgi:hypothetical protein